MTKLVNGYRQHNTENCTGSLIRVRHRLLIVSAWHCFDGIRDLSRPPIITMSDDSRREARLLKTGQSIDADWAVLEFTTSRFDDRQLVVLPLDTAALPETGQAVLMAGFNSDYFGDGGETLTYDPKCHIEERDSFNLTTNCVAFKGASGGPVLRRLDNGRYALSGIVSRGDNRKVSIFLHTQGFYRQLPRAF
ncbi:trypsin-like serine peptidase [Luminiphilus syltensis]|uniref:trypsin-like serine peptidase n=1 Tax=Luminiphilus syltensis TaxID=1341119 RepID=UPI00058F40CD|nr:serine protease [Luminiphilus syltensis]